MFFLLAVLILALVLVFLHQTYSRFDGTGVKYHRPFPFLGNMWRMVLKAEHMADYYDKMYNDFPEERFVGRYAFIKPVMLIRDLELIKSIALKDFEHFLDHRMFVQKENDALLGRNLFSLKGQEWKDMRSTLSPAFTSSKIRMMVPFMVEVGDQMIDIITQKIKASKDGYVDLDAKDLSSRYANDVIASCAFGLKVNSHAEEANEFYVISKETATLNFKQFLLFIGFASIPKIMNALKFSLFSENTKNFFRNLVLGSMKDREERNIVRHDMIHLLMEAKKGRLTHDIKGSDKKDADAGFATVEESAVGKKENDRMWSDDDLTAQAILFLIAGFETVSSTMAFLTHELAVNPEVQDKLVQEIREVDEKNGGKFDYNTIQNMKYMDMVLSELLRLWPPVVNLDRLCTKDFNLGKPNDNATQDFILRKGEGIGIPSWSIHRDAKFYPNPLKFDPERFSDENKHKIQPFTYMPFGLGPRNCIGSRFAICEMKVMIFQLLQSFQLSPGAQLKLPVKLSRDTFNIWIEGGHWVRFTVRS